MRRISPSSDASRALIPYRTVQAPDPLHSIENLRQEIANTAVDVIPDLADHRQVLVSRVREIPVQISLSWEHRARVSASHRDHDVRFPDVVCCQHPWRSILYADSPLGERCHGHLVDLVPWSRSGGSDTDASHSVVVEQRCCHLGAPGIVDADEEDLWCHGSFRGTGRYYSHHTVF